MDPEDNLKTVSKEQGYRRRAGTLQFQSQLFW